MAIEIPIAFDVSSNLDSELDKAADAGERVSRSISSTLSSELDASADSAKRFAISSEGAAAGADELGSGASQAAGGLGDLGGALSLIPGPLGGLGAGMELAAPAIQGVTGAADLVNLALDKMKLGTLAAKAATAAKTVVDTVAAVATNILAGATRALGLAIRFATGPVGLIILGITALVTAIVVAYKNSETFRNIVNGVFEAVKAVVVPVMEAVGNAISAVFNWAKRNWPLILAILTGPIGIAVLLITKNFDKIKGAISAVWNFVKSATSAAWNAIKTVVVGGVEGIIKLVTGIPKAIINLGASMLNAGKDLMKALFNGIVEGAKGVGGFVGSIIEALKNGINDLLNLPLTVGPIKVLGKTVLPELTLIPRFAGGTDFAPGGFALVGEEGPELVNLPRGSQVLTASQTRDSLGGRGDVTVIQNFNGPNTSAGRLRELEWTLKFATGRLPRQNLTAEVP